MLNYIVLGQVPGTDYYLNFTNVLIMYCGLLVLFIVLAGARHLMGRLPEEFEINDLQQQYLQPKKSRASLSELLITMYTTLAVWIIMKNTRTNQNRLKSRLFYI